MTRVVRVCAVIAFLSPLTAYTLWPLKFMDWDDGMIDQGWAIGYVCVAIVFWKGIQDRFVRFVGEIGFWLAVNNLADEFLFNPEETGWNEYLFAVIVIIITAWRLLRYKKR